MTKNPVRTTMADWIVDLALAMKWVAFAAVGAIAADGVFGRFFPGDSGYPNSTWRELGFDVGLGLLMGAVVVVVLCFVALSESLKRRRRAR